MEDVELRDALLSLARIATIDIRTPSHRPIENFHIRTK